MAMSAAISLQMTEDSAERCCPEQRCIENTIFTLVYGELIVEENALLLVVTVVAGILQITI